MTSQNQYLLRFLRFTPTASESLWEGRNLYECVLTTLCVYVCVCVCVCAQLLSLSHSFVTPWTVAHQSPLSMGLFRHEHWSELPFSPPGELPYPGILHWQVDSLPLKPLGKPLKLY